MMGSQSDLAAIQLEVWLVKNRRLCDGCEHFAAPSAFRDGKDAALKLDAMAKAVQLGSCAAARATMSLVLQALMLIIDRNVAEKGSSDSVRQMGLKRQRLHEDYGLQAASR